MSKNVRRLYEGFQPDHYQLSLTPDIQTGLVHGEVIITGRKTGRPSQRLTFHQHGLTVIQASITKHNKKSDGPTQDIAVARINVQKSLDELRLHSSSLLYPGVYTVAMHFIAPLQSTMHGIYRSNYTIDSQDSQDRGLSLISTQFESHHAREAFPCIDEPEAKASFGLTLITPAGQTVISNMPVVEQHEVGLGQATLFQTTPRMSTYLLAFVIGDMQRATTTTKDGVEVNVYATKAHRPAALDFALETTKRCIEFFNDYYGIPYPLPKCDMVAIPDFSSAAMENWGLVTYREPYILADPQTASQSSRELIALVICHELSHQWFGNLVTMKWWDDLWLNESFANVMEYVGVDDLFPEWHIFNTFIAQEGLAAFRRDSIAGVQSIKTEVRHPDEISTLFDPSIVYAKGGRLLNMLRNYIGETAFRQGLTQYFAKHQYGNTTGDDLWASLSETSGKDIAGFMNPWLERSGFPLVTVDQQGSRLTISQRHFVTDPSKADAKRLWSVPLLADSSDIDEVLSASTITYDLKASSSSDSSSQAYVRINQNAVGHYLVRYHNPEHRLWVAKQAQTKELNEAERLMLLSDSVLLARNGSDSLATSLTLLNYYTAEDSEPVWDMLALVVADARRFVDSEPKLEEAIKAFIRKLIENQYQRLGWEVHPGEISQDTKLRASILGLGSYAEHPTIKAKALELFGQYKNNPKQNPAVVDSELRDILFTTAIRYQAPGAFEYLLELEESTTNPDLKQELMGSLSTTRDVERGKQLLARIKDSKKVRQHDIDHWLLLLVCNRYCQQDAWDWLRANWPWIEKTFAGDKSYDSLPRYVASAFNTPQRLEEYRDFFGPKVTQPVLTRNITMGIEELENRIAWIERDLSSVKSYFKIQVQA